MVAFNLFEMATVGHVSHGLWRHPDNQRERTNDIEYWAEIAQLAEDGLLNAFFIADILGIRDEYRHSSAPALEEAQQVPNNDPTILATAIAAVTREIGVAITFSATYEPPFAWARRISTLDHLSKGRVGWNIVTSRLESAARNFGLDEQIEHDTRYDFAEEYLDVLYKLWEGSWDDDALVRDKGGVYTDPSKVRYINHVGERFRVAGPHLSEPSPQRTPLLFQAGASDRGLRFAARHAEAIYTQAGSLPELKRYIDALRDAAVAEGRRRDDIKPHVGLITVVDKDHDRAYEKLDELLRHSSLTGNLIQQGGRGIDWATYPADALISEVVGTDKPTIRVSGTEFPITATVGEVVHRIVNFNEGPLVAIGTPVEVADKIERIVAETGVDGFNLRQNLSPGTLRDFVELVVPELQKRGLYRSSREPGLTLRESLFGKGSARLNDRHPGAQYRGGRGLEEFATDRFHPSQLPVG